MKLLLPVFLVLPMTMSACAGIESDDSVDCVSCSDDGDNNEVPYEKMTETERRLSDNLDALLSDLPGAEEGSSEKGNPTFLFDATFEDCNMILVENFSSLRDLIGNSSARLDLEVYDPSIALQSANLEPNITIYLSNKESVELSAALLDRKLWDELLFQEGGSTCHLEDSMDLSLESEYGGFAAGGNVCGTGLDADLETLLSDIMLSYPEVGNCMFDLPSE